MIKKEQYSHHSDAWAFGMLVTVVFDDGTQPLPAIDRIARQFSVQHISPKVHLFVSSGLLVVLSHPVEYFPADVANQQQQQQQQVLHLRCVYGTISAFLTKQWTKQCSNFYFHRRTFGASFVGLWLTLLAATIIEVCSEGATPIAADVYAYDQDPGGGPDGA